jgi:hypothetical protein
LVRFGDEDTGDVWCPGTEIVIDDEGMRWVALPIDDTPPPVTDPWRYVQWLSFQRDLEEVARRERCTPKRTYQQDRNVQIVAAYKDEVARDPSRSDWAICGKLKERFHKTQGQIRRILKQAGVARRK